MDIERYRSMIEGLRASRPEKVTVKLFKDSSRYKSDVFAAVNGRRYLIKRGVEVEVPYDIGQVLFDQESQDTAAAARISELSGASRFA